MYWGIEGETGHYTNQTYYVKIKVNIVLVPCIIFQMVMEVLTSCCQFVQQTIVKKVTFMSTRMVM